MNFTKEHYEEYISHLYEKSCNIVKRDTSICFNDCTNYYFEIETDDEDYVDEVTGEIIKRLRKLKRGRKPVKSMVYCLFPFQ